MNMELINRFGNLKIKLSLQASADDKVK